MWGLFGGLMNWKSLLIMKMILSFKIVVFAAADFGPARVLPKGRHQMTLRFGEKSHLSEKFDSAGTLQSAQRLNQRFDKEFLIQQNPQLKQLVGLIDSLYPHQNVSQNLDPGALGFQGDAAARYVIPQIARGMTSRWSLGVAIPIVDFKTTVKPTNMGANKTSKLFGTMSADNAAQSAALGQAEALFRGGPTSLFNSMTDGKGYKRVEPRNDTFVADIVVGSNYKLFQNRQFGMYAMNLLTLPTGPKDDPDDLVDLGVFHKTALKNVLYTNYSPRNDLEFGLGVYYTAQFEDDMVKRVPTSETDTIPDASTKETVDRNPGDKLGIESAVVYMPHERVEFGFGYDFESKQKDSYSGSKGSRYDLLENNTDTEVQILRLKASYTTVTSFVGGKSQIPYSITYAYADFFDGKNVEREKTHEMLLKFYF